MMTVIGLGVDAEAQSPCQEHLRLRNAATASLETGDESTAIKALLRDILPKLSVKANVTDRQGWPFRLS
jgi:hypothetical protein